ncbi:hypothetical protein MKQ68_07750 [Chitinophaga horti]|uniref:DUF4142 domain-containing protein n=1 Tax=Chitinophaga horti TaxID=2920382 RepID=A0ABY6J5N0_9BACT|nr:hypothetical protein [Chitinophaga horti]UYQ94986.1 hypothetical protein MKQ68_07750 [Chitinophaga horti]
MIKRSLSTIILSLLFLARPAAAQGIMDEMMAVPGTVVSFFSGLIKKGESLATYQDKKSFLKISSSIYSKTGKVIKRKQQVLAALKDSSATRQQLTRDVDKWMSTMRDLIEIVDKSNDIGESVGTDAINQLNQLTADLNGKMAYLESGKLVNHTDRAEAAVKLQESIDVLSKGHSQLKVFIDSLRKSIE